MSLERSLRASILQKTHRNNAANVTDEPNEVRSVSVNTKCSVDFSYVRSNSTADELDKTLKRFLISVVGRCTRQIFNKSLIAVLATFLRRVTSVVVSIKLHRLIIRTR